MSASSRSTMSALASNFTLASGATLRIDSITVANNTATPQVVNIKSADGTYTYRTIVVPAYDTKGDSGDFSFIADKGVLVPAVDANVFITFTHSAEGV